MAPTKKKAAAKSEKISSKTSDDGVVKRPARGFHRFRNGILNVTPKGSEKELVQANQGSPLLRLPPELRSRIWEYVLGGHTLRFTVFKHTDPRTPARMVPPVAERMYGLDLLRTCRQIYTETALLPYKTNTFTFSPYDEIPHRLRYMKPFQRANIERIQYEGDHSPSHYYSVALAHTLNKDKLKSLPGLRHVHVVNFRYCPNNSPVLTQEETEAIQADMRSELDLLLAGQDLTISCDVIENDDWRGYARNWAYPYNKD